MRRPGAAAFHLLLFSALGFLAVFFVVLVAYTYTQYRPTSLPALLLARDVRFAIGLSLLCATVTTFLALLLAVPAGYVLSRKHIPGKIFLDTLLDIPVFVSPVALGALLLILFSSPAGRLVQEHTVPVVFALPGIVVAQFTVVVGLAVRILKNTFDQIPARLEEVSRTLGCTPAQAFFRVTLPLARGGILAAAVVCWARALGEFGATVTLVGAAPLKTETIPTAIYLSFASADVDRALTMVAVLILTALAGLLLLRAFSGSGRGIRL